MRRGPFLKVGIARYGEQPDHLYNKRSIRMTFDRFGN